MLGSIIFQKLMRCTVALDMIQWQDPNAKGRAAEVLLQDAMMMAMVNQRLLATK